MTTENTLLGRCTAIHVETLYGKAGLQRVAVAAVLDHLAAEIAVMLERNPNLTPHQLITILRMEAAGELAGFEHEPA